MAFDWGALERASGQMGNILAGGLVQKHERKQERKDFEEKQRFVADIRKTEQRATWEHDEEVDAERRQNDRIDFEWRTDYTARVAKFGGDPEFARWIKEQMSSNTGSAVYDSIRRMSGASVLTAWTKLKAGEILTDEDKVAFKILPDQAQSTVSELMNERKEKRDENERRDRQLDGIIEAQKKNMEYLDSLIDQIELGKPRDPFTLMKDRSTYLKKINDMVGSQEYQMLSRTFREEGLEGMTPEQRTDWLTMKKAVQSDQKLLYVIDGYLTMYGMGDNLEPAPPTPDVDTEGKENKFDKHIQWRAEQRQLSLAERDMGEKAYGKLERKITNKEIKKVKKEKGITEKIYSVDEIPALRKAGASSEGKYVYAPDPVTRKPTLFVMIKDPEREGGLRLQKVE